MMTAALVIPWLLVLPALPGLLLVLGPFVGLALGPTQIHESFSPDRKHRVVITQFEKEFFNLDRPVDLRVNLEEVATGRVIDQVFVGIAEDSDVGSPSVAWDLRHAIVTNLEREHALTITLRRVEPVSGVLQSPKLPM
ncbi:MAG: hypothetical protein M3541_10875 [Acidobacteriota bacterium]|nr:hypothetical protein [Acidobacteriota bacterium]